MPIIKQKKKKRKYLLKNMISYLLELIKHSFGLTLWVTIPVLFIGIIAIVMMILFTMVLFLDSIYKPSSPQYPFNFVLD